MTVPWSHRDYSNMNHFTLDFVNAIERIRYENDSDIPKSELKLLFDIVKIYHQESFEGFTFDELNNN